MAKKRNTQMTLPVTGFDIFSRYIRFFHDNIYYRKVYTEKKENIPSDVPLMIVSNHQNGLNDALGLFFSVRSATNRRVKMITRADVFQYPFARRFLRWLGLLPAFRLSFEGEESLANNAETFALTEEELLNNGTIVVFPEAGHQDKRWLGKFSHGYLRILFEAAAKSNFEKELFILPSCNHYSDYFGLQEQLLIRYGTPVSIAPYYELYQTKPRTAQRQLNALIWKQISDMMLNITDLDNYSTIDYLRNTYGIRYAEAKGFNPDSLPEKLNADKQLFARLKTLKENRKELIEPLYDDVATLEKQTKKSRINDRNFEIPIALSKMILSSLLLIVLFPVFVVSLIPNGLIWLIPCLITGKIKDSMLHSSIRLVVSLLLTVPLFYGLTFLLVWFFTKSLIIALFHLLCLPFLGVFAWRYTKTWDKWIDKMRFYRLTKTGQLNDLIQLRSNIYRLLDKLLDISDNKKYKLKTEL
ncbi:MAG: 1-acyl-sn-glycerol-3-phosphate acyltransferase [Bacteroidales bacterium]|jgi:1-acyl-sn-glycerol-3-phosphate acyltransferase|nr:1-acyl-sn-glycerol-3-phosphate acyltransferase [Bacteroidales bacterium]